ncbi:SOS response-associated peptidase [Vibrio sp. WXL103]|uniref:SOS response-associated peptidase n=1 Tax=Vibrio sp. WXL103 TaxID=3450710 RepID=UPI003EC75005
MCGRLNIIDDPLCTAVTTLLGVTFSTPTNQDLRPTEQVATLIHHPSHGHLASSEPFSSPNHHAGFKQINLAWGIQPNWSKRIIINAQAESVANKVTFRNAFQQARVIVPCSGWYEWATHAGVKKRYLFAQPNGSPVWIAGIAFDDSKLVTLTTSANAQCADYHHRMPLLLEDGQLDTWLAGSVQEAHRLTTQCWQPRLVVSRCERV